MPSLREIVERRILPRVKTPGQYVGGELHSVVKDPATVQGRVCMAFPDTYTLGMSHHGLQILYSLLNADPRWACERAFTPFPDFEAELRKHNLPLYSLENFSPLNDFDIVGLSLQYEVCYTNILTILDLGRIPMHADQREPDDALVVAGGPGAQNPEIIAPFVDVFIVGDGEETLPALLERWVELRDRGLSRGDRIAEAIRNFPWAYSPRFLEPEYHQNGQIACMNRTRADVRVSFPAATIDADFDDLQIPIKPIVPFVECAHERIAIEIMRGCPWQCRFCQSTVIKRPLRVRSVEKIIEAAKEAHRNTGYDEISILSLSTSDYPYFEQLVEQLSEVFRPLHVNISVPSLRVNEQFRNLPRIMAGSRKAGLTLAPEVARDDMRDQIRKPIDNDDLYEGCRLAFAEGWTHVKLYFMCGLPGERQVDLDGIVELSERISRIGKEVTGHFIPVTASVSNFVPKPHTPYQWDEMKPREYFAWAHRYLRQQVRMRSVKIKCHDIERSLLEGILTRGDRRIAPVIEAAWRRGARLDAWDEYFQPQIWWDTFAELGIDPTFYSQRARATSEVLPWDHINVKKGRDWLEKEHGRAVVQLTMMASAT